MIKILFICHGSICRSPMARFIFQNEIDKLGLHDKFYVNAKAVSEEEIGNDMYPPAKKCLLKHNIKFEKTSSSKVTLSDYSYYDYLIIMDKSNRYLLNQIIGNDSMNKVYTLLSFQGLDRDISDPWYTGDFELCYKDIEYGVKGLISKLI